MGGQVTGAECGRTKHIHVLVSEDHCNRLNKAVNFLRALEPDRNWSQGTIVDAALAIILPVYEEEVSKRLYPPAVSPPAVNPPVVNPPAPVEQPAAPVTAAASTSTAKSTRKASGGKK